MSATILGGDITVYFSTDNNQIRSAWSGAATGTRTMNEFYSASMTLYALSAQMSERVNLTAQTPVDYTAVNGHFVDDTTAEHLTGGTLQSSGWAANVIIAKPYDKTGGSATDFAAADIGKTIVGTTTTDSGTIVDFNTVLAQEVVWIRPDDVATDLFDNDTEAFTVTAGTGAAIFAGAETTGEAVWANPNTIASLASNTLVYIFQAVTATGGADNRARVIATKGTKEWWPEGNIDILLKIQNDGVLLDEGYATFFAHQFTQLYSHSVVDLSAGARTPIALETQNDLNNDEGFRQLVTGAPVTGTWGASEVGLRVNEDVPTPTKEAVITSISGTTPAYTMQYYPVGDLTDFVTTDVFETPDATKDATINGAPTAVNATATPDSTITVTHAAVERDLNNGNGSQPYSIEIDAQATPINDVYERLKYLTRRGETSTSSTDGIHGQEYIGNEYHLSYTVVTSAFSEGDQVWMHTSGDVLVGTGILVADHLASDEMILRNFRRYASGAIAKAGNNSVVGSYTVEVSVQTERGIAAVKAAPFGTFAGGTFFGAPGVWILDLFVGDEQAFQLIDDLGATQSPPNTVAITVTNLLAGDSVGVFRRINTNAGSDVDRLEYTSTGTQGPATPTAAGATTFDCAEAVTNEAPDAGVIQIYDISTKTVAAIPAEFTPLNETIRYRYSSVARATGIFTLDFVTNSATTPAGSATQLNDSVGTPFTSVQIGDFVRNISDPSWAIVTQVNTDNQLTHTELQGSGALTWAATDVYEINMIARPYVVSDEVWVPFILKTADATDAASGASNSIIHTDDIPVRVVVRNAGDIEPFAVDTLIQNTGMSQAVIRNADTIFV